DLLRPALCADALRLGRILAELAPREPEVHGLVALMELQASRLRARVGPGGEPVLLLDQDPGRRDPPLLRHGPRGPHPGAPRACAGLLAQRAHAALQGVRAAGRAGPGRRARRRADAPRLPPPAERAR